MCQSCLLGSLSRKKERKSTIYVDIRRVRVFETSHQSVYVHRVPFVRVLFEVNFCSSALTGHMQCGRGNGAGYGIV